MSTIARATIALCLPRSGHLFIIPKGNPQVRLHIKPSLTPLMAEVNSNNSESERSYIDKLALVLLNDKRQQLVARSKGKTAFFTPGGKREGNESDVDALCRECKEELTVNLTRESIKKYGVFEAQAFGKPVGTMVRMTCYTSDFDGDLTPQSEIEELKWINSSCPREILTETGIMILEDLKEKNLID